MVASKFIKSSFSAIQKMRTTNIIQKTELQYNQRISDRLGCNLFLKEKIYKVLEVLKFVVLIIK